MPQPTDPYAEQPSKRPAIRPPTTKQQRTGFKFLKRRQETAWRTGKVPDGSDVNPWSMQNAMLGGGGMVVAFIGILAFIFSLLKPAPEKGVDEIVIADGGTFVMYGDVLHPVTNLASARLIIGKPDNPQVVKNSSLEGIPRGPRMGILSAPDNLNARSDDPATWTVCDERDAAASLELTTTKALTTTVVAGADLIADNAADLGDSKAILARSDLDPSKLWLLFGGNRAEVGIHDFPTHAALGLTPARIESAQTLTSKLINAIPVLPPLAVPYIENRGRLSTDVEGRVIGDVLTITTPDGERESYVVADNGVQRIQPPVAALLINTGSRQITVNNPEDVTMLNQVRVVDTSRYPVKLPEVMTPRAVCYSWARDRPTGSVPVTRILYGDSLPLTDKGKGEYRRPLNTPAKGVTQADYFAMTPGKGWYTYVTGFSEALRQEQIVFIEDTGIRYFVSPDEKNNYIPVLTALGLNWQEPMPIVWPIAELFMQGATLSREAALVEQPYIPQPPGAKKVDATPGQVNAFETQTPEPEAPAADPSAVAPAP